MDDTLQAHSRWFHLTPGRVVLLLLAVECLLWLSERIGWLGWHKGYAVLTGVASIGVAMLVILGWFGVAVVFRRRFQFSIRSLLVLVVVVALPFSWLAVELKKANKQRDAVEALAACNLFSRHDWEEEFHDGVQEPREPPGLAWLRSHVGDEFFGDIIEVASLIGRPEGDEDVEYGPIFDQLSHLPRIRSLSLSLWDYDSMTDTDLARLRDLASLRELAFNASQITDRGIKYLGELDELEVLRLASCGESSKITDGGLQHLKGLRRLRILWLFGTNVTDAGLHTLQGLTALNELNLERTKVTDAGIAKLQQALPNCEITH